MLKYYFRLVFVCSQTVIGINQLQPKGNNGQTSYYLLIVKFFMILYKNETTWEYCCIIWSW